MRSFVGAGYLAAGLHASKSRMIVMQPPAEQPVGRVARPLSDERALRPHARIVIASAQPLFLDGLAAALEAEPDASVVGRCADDESVRDTIRELRPDVALLDIGLSRPEGWALLRQLAAESQLPKLVVLTPHIDDEALVEAVRLGIRGVVPKSIDSSIVVQCVRHVHGGGYWLDKQMTTSGLRTMVRREATERRLADVGLTRRELQVAALAGRGLSVSAIAPQLKISAGTVKVHLHQVYRKLGLTDRAALIVYTREHALA